MEQFLGIIRCGFLKKSCYTSKLLQQQQQQTKNNKKNYPRMSDHLKSCAFVVKRWRISFHSLKVFYGLFTNEKSLDDDILFDIPITNVK